MAERIDRATAAPRPARAGGLRARLHGRGPLLVLVVAGLLVLALSAAILLYGNKLPVGSTGFWTIVQLRATSILTIIVVAFCQAVGTLIFHTATNNRILTPSILGFDALYTVMQTALVFFFGIAASSANDGLLKVAAQSALMIVFASLLYGWLFSGKRANLLVLLLVGVVLGMGFRSLSTFMQRMLTPSEFDVLAAKLFGNISNSNPEYLPWAIGICVIVGAVLWRRRHTLDVVALGRDTSTALGVRYRREVIAILVIVAVLISISTTMVGPMTFFGFLVATLTYQVAGSYKHSLLLPLVTLLGAATLLAAYFVLRHVFYAGGMISVIIEFVGGLVFLVYVLRKGIK